MTPGIHLIHKPVGPTSFSLVQACIAAAEIQQPHRRAGICHGGTLDPFASGLLLMLAFPATRLFEYLHDVPKTYEATVRWGIETDNGDLLGRPIFTGDPTDLVPGKLDEALGNFVGWQEQLPPATSAKRIDGERAYLKAHRGESVVMSPVRVYLHEACWLDHNLPLESRLRVTVRGGFYVRALARDLGRRVGCGAHLTQLHRHSIGPWTDPGPDRQVELVGRGLLPWLAVRDLSDADVGELRKNRPIAIGNVGSPDWQLPAGFPGGEPRVRGIHLEKLVYLLTISDGKLQVAVALNRGV